MEKTRRETFTICAAIKSSCADVGLRAADCFSVGIDACDHVRLGRAGRSRWSWKLPAAKRRGRPRPAVLGCRGA